MGRQKQLATQSHQDQRNDYPEKRNHKTRSSNHLRCNKGRVTISSELPSAPILKWTNIKIESCPLPHHHYMPSACFDQSRGVHPPEPMKHFPLFPKNMLQKVHE